MTVPLVTRSHLIETITSQLNGTPVFLGTVVFSTTAANNNSGTSTNSVGATGGFNVALVPADTGLQGLTLLIVASAACFWLPETSKTSGITTSNGVPLAINGQKIVVMADGYKWLSAIASGGGNLQVWKLVA